MADVRPLCAVHYDPDRIGDLADVVAPPYDVIDAAGRADLIARSPHNVVELDLPEDAGGGDIYAHAAELFAQWSDEGVLAADDEESIWALEQEYVGPDGSRRVRRGFLARVRVTGYGPGKVRPHERTQPGPKEDRLRLTRATGHNLSPIFSLHTGPNAWPLMAPAAGDEPWGEVTDPDGTTHRVWRITDPAALSAVTGRLADAELLIADGHHRYETARTYANEVGGEGEHRYTLMALVALDDPGLTVFGYHRLLTDLGESEVQVRLRDVMLEYFDVTTVPIEEIDPAGAEGIGVFGYIDAHHRQAFRLKLKDPSILEAKMPGRSQAYRELDAAILETLILREALGLSEADVEAKRGLAYTASADAALASLDGKAHAAVLMRPTPVDQVRAVAAEGETMPPKSTYFYPKLLTGLVFNPLR